MVRTRKGADEQDAGGTFGKCMLGAKVRKHFPRYGWVAGKIERVLEIVGGDPVYCIKYVDGDEERLSHDEMETVFVRHAFQAKAEEVSSYEMT